MVVKRNNKPQFCIITPTAYLERYASQSSMHLVLAHLVDKDEEYASFYASRNEYKIMDNGAYELGESYSPKRLVELGKKCKANAIVLPDYPAQHYFKTITAAVDLIPEVREAGFDTFFCPQSEVGHWDGFVESYKWAADNNEIDIIGMSILALPNALPHIPASYARVVGTELLIRGNIFNFNKYHHYLGLNAGPALEIPPLVKMNVLDSCDSSGPVWAAIHGYEYSKSTDSYLSVNKKELPHVDFEWQPEIPHKMNRTKWESSKIKTTEEQRIQHNINLTLELFNGTNPRNGN